MPGLVLGYQAAGGKAPPPATLEPVRLVVVESGTERPVTKFRFRYGVTAAHGEGPRRRAVHHAVWRKVAAEDGTVEIPDVPATARVSVSIIAPGYLGIRTAETERCFQLDADTADRGLRMELMRAVRVRGVVRNAKTKQPIAGATAHRFVQAPLPVVGSLTMMPLGSPLSPFRARGEPVGKTDARGRFEFDILSGGEFVLRHAGYLELRWQTSNPDEYDGSDVWELIPKSRETVSGVVVGADDKRPLADVRVVDPSGMEAKTDGQGRFSIEAIHDRHLAFVRSGRVSTIRRAETWKVDPLRVEMWPSCRFVVSVRDASGRPAPHYDLSVGPGRTPEGFMCNDYQVRSPDGRYPIALGEKAHEECEFADTWFADERDEYTELWIGVRTPDHATAETWIAPDDPPGIVQLRLRSGQDVMGRIEAGNEPLEDVSVTLKPMLPQHVVKMWDWGSESYRQEFFTHKTVPDRNGAFRFANVVAGRVYVATIDVGPLRFCRLVPVVEGAEPTVLAPIRLPECGTITGRIYRAKGDRREPWPFKTGSVSVSKNSGPFHAFGPLSFITDRSGRFTIRHVPAGWATVWVQDTPNFLKVHARRARVLPGQVTEIRMFDPSGDWDVPVVTQVGDGSPQARLAGVGYVDRGEGLAPHVRHLESVSSGVYFRLTPPDDGPCSPGDGLRDVTPGHWRIAAHLRHDAPNHPLLHQDVDTRPGMPPVQVPLSACSLVAVTDGLPEADGPISLFTIDSQRQTLARVSRFLRATYHPPGVFGVTIHRDAHWCRRANVRVREKQVTTVKMPAWQPGGTIRVRYTLRRPLPVDAAERDVQLELLAVDSLGRRLEFPDAAVVAFDGLTSRPYTLGGLWPGKWRVELRCGGKVAASADVALTGTETVECRLDR